MLGFPGDGIASNFIPFFGDLFFADPALDVLFAADPWKLALTSRLTLYSFIYMFREKILLVLSKLNNFIFKYRMGFWGFGVLGFKGF